ncbi:MAG TPA: NUDIX domain-containing protein [Stellaceae bacterium]|nr:NUDIX domain-containing protein [Stellaceae bacterium]
MTSPSFPVSIKGVVLFGGRILLLENERDEWELPGGRLELGEDPPECLAREIDEELGIAVEVGPILDSWCYEPLPGRIVVIVTYGCQADSAVQPRLSHEHRALGLFTVPELDGLRLPAGYRRSIDHWLKLSRSG